jgi:hypothetical protein
MILPGQAVRDRYDDDEPPPFSVPRQGSFNTREILFFFLKAILFFFFFESDSVFILVWHQPVKTLENSVETRGGSIRLDDALRETPSRKSETLPE